MGANAEPQNIREFIKLILRTEVSEAKEWVVKFIAPIPGWDSYAKMAITEPSVECIASGISAEISKHLRAISGMGNPYADVAERGHKLLQEIYQKATALGLDIDLKKIDFIIEPRMPSMA